MNATTSQGPSSQPEEPGIRRYRAESQRSPRRPPLVNLAILIGAIGLIVFLIYQFFFTRPQVTAGEEFNLSKSIERIQELSTVRSHLRFAVIVREEAGNIIVRQIADEPEEITMDGIGAMLFHDPTLVAELHAVITYGLRLDGMDGRIRDVNDTVYIALPSAELLDVKVVNADTRIIARLEGLFRRTNNELLLEASRRGETFARQFALDDSSSINLAESRAREIITMLVEQAGSKVSFTEKGEK